MQETLLRPAEDAPHRVYIETYGCQMNVADSEVVASIVGMAGYTATDDIDRADGFGNRVDL